MLFGAQEFECLNRYTSLPKGLNLSLLLYIAALFDDSDVSSASNKAKMFAQIFFKNSNLHDTGIYLPAFPALPDTGISLPAFPSRTNLGLHNNHITPNLVIKEFITNFYSSNIPKLNCISEELKNSEPKLLCTLAVLFNSSLKESYFLDHLTRFKLTFQRCIMKNYLIKIYSFERHLKGHSD